jgi:thiol:disulfide interchange protein DsbC
MESDMKKTLRKAGAIPLAAALCMALLPVRGVVAAGCPSEDTVVAAMEKSFRKKVQVRRIRPAPVEGLCEIIVLVQGRSSIVYSDGSGRYFVTGQIIDAETRQDLSRAALAEFNRFTPEEMEKLESLTALTLGDSGPEVYFVTDPD